MKDRKIWAYGSPGIDDELFIRGEVPMTKSEVRAVTISKLKLQSGMKFMDIGAGTGSISIEAALMGCNVTALERNELGVDLINENAALFGQLSIKTIHGSAPHDLPRDGRYDRVFIGGTGGKIEGIFKYLESHLNRDGMVVANTITIENTSKFMQIFKHYNYTDIEAIQVNVNKSRAVGNVHMMIAENPITIIRAVKSEIEKGDNHGKSTVHRSRTWRPRPNNN